MHDFPVCLFNPAFRGCQNPIGLNRLCVKPFFICCWHLLKLLLTCFLVLSRQFIFTRILYVLVTIHFISVLLTPMHLYFAHRLQCFEIKLMITMLMTATTSDDTCVGGNTVGYCDEYQKFFTSVYLAHRALKRPKVGTGLYVLLAFKNI